LPRPRTAANRHAHAIVRAQNFSAQRERRCARSHRFFLWSSGIHDRSISIFCRLIGNVLLQSAWYILQQRFVHSVALR